MPSKHHDSFLPRKICLLSFLLLSISFFLFLPKSSVHLITFYSLPGYRLIFFSVSALFGNYMSASSSCTYLHFPFCHESLVDDPKLHLPAALIHLSSLQPSLLIPECLSFIRQYINRSDQGLYKMFTTLCYVSYILH